MDFVNNDCRPAKRQKHMASELQSNPPLYPSQNGVQLSEGNLEFHALPNIGLYQPEPRPNAWLAQPQRIAYTPTYSNSQPTLQIPPLFYPQSWPTQTFGSFPINSTFYDGSTVSYIEATIQPWLVPPGLPPNSYHIPTIGMMTGLSNGSLFSESFNNQQNLYGTFDSQPYIDMKPQGPNNSAVGTVSYVNEAASKTTALSEVDVCCFGMISGVAGSFECLGTHEMPPSFNVKLESKNSFLSEQFCFTGRINEEYGTMLQGLLDVPEISINTKCVTIRLAAKGKPRTKDSSKQCELELTIFGDTALFEEVGRWLQDFDVYLQDPKECLKDVKYCNPHRLSFIDIQSCSMLSDAIQGSVSLHLQAVADRPNLLDAISNSIDLQEAIQPRFVKSTLERHQRQALHFMICREQGWGNHHNIPDIWESIDNGEQRIYVNRISGVSQCDLPRQIYGGIIGDPMGLGKTLSILALIAADLDNSTPNMGIGNHEGDDGVIMSSIPATLVIVPPPLLSAWEEQLSDHLFPNALSCSRYHGSDKAIARDTMNTTRLVLTTYQTVSAEWKKSIDSGDSTIFSVRWRRVVIDEAHFISNANSMRSRAVCALQADARWAVTGTPIQNRLTDLSSLLKFIRAYPYTDPKRFEADISHIWKYGQAEEAVERLKRLTSSLLLRRPKATIPLPRRTDFECPVSFSAQEKQAYASIRQQAIDHIHQKESEGSASNVFANVLQQIEALRLFCSLGLRYSMRHKVSENAESQNSGWDKMAQKVFNAQNQMGSIICFQCEAVLDLTEGMLGDNNRLRQEGQFSKCLKFLCAECSRKSNSVLRCDHRPQCPTASVLLDINAWEEARDADISAPMDAFLPFPSKVRALVADLQSLPPGIKCLVFSTWRFTLDVVAAALEQANFPCLRFDGKLPQKERQSVVDRFRRDDSIRIMLLTLSCGAVGLNLTAASRAYLLEPHWNPTVEEQALARIHRLGQTQEVTTVRLYVRDSFEESVREMQKFKQQLADILLSPHGDAQSDTSRSVLDKLRSLL